MIFRKYNIPVFVDEKDELSQNILVRYVLSIFEIFEKKWSKEAVFNYIKSGFCDVTQQEIYELDNYCTKNEIKGSKWYKQEWQEYEYIRKKIVNPLLKLKQDITATETNSKTAKTMVLGLYEFLEKNNIHEKLSEKIEKLININEINIAKEYTMSLQIIYDVLDEIILFFGDEKISYERFKNILKTGLDSKELGNIPQFMDEVILGDINRSKTHKVKAVFILGLNDGVFPSVNKNEGFLNDKDRETLKSMDAEIAKGTLENLYEDQFNIYKAFSIAEEKVFLSYQSTNKEGKALRPSVLISKIKKIYPNIQEKSDVINKSIEIISPEATYDNLLININKISSGEVVDEIWYDVYNWYMQNETWKNKLKSDIKWLNYTNIPEKIKDENIKKLYGNKLKTSISKLEQYRKCPFSFHLKYGLRIKEKDEFTLRSIDTGSFMHDVIAEFFQTIEGVEKLEEGEIEEVVNNIVNEKLGMKQNYIFTSSPKFVVLTKKLKKTVIESIKYIVNQLKNSQFKIYNNEEEFCIDIGNIELTGKIDRIDRAKIENKDFVRIIDYKSSSKDIDLNEVVEGLQIQLLTYLDAVTNSDKLIPAGVLYFNLINPIVQSDKNLSEEEIKKEIIKQFKMKGLILSDINVIKLMDKTLEKGASESIPVYIDKDGNISNTRSSVINEEDFVNLQKKVMKVIKQISNEILNGNIDIKPIYNCKTKISACKYCNYKTICTFESNVNTYDYLTNKPKEVILKGIKE